MVKNAAFASKCFWGEGQAFPCYVYIGVEDKWDTDTFTYITSGNPVYFYVWGSGEPHGGPYDCVYIDGADRKWHNWDCFSDHITNRALCEIDGGR